MSFLQRVLYIVLALLGLSLLPSYLHAQDVRPLDLGLGSAVYAAHAGAQADSQDVKWPDAYLSQAMLATALQSADKTDELKGLGYLAGVSDAINLQRAINHSDPCPDYTYNQMRTLFLAYALKNPQTGNADAAFAATMAVCGQ